MRKASLLLRLNLSDHVFAINLMTSGKQIIFKVIFGLLITAIIAGAFFIYSHYHTQLLPAIDAVPEDAVFYLELNNSPKFINKLLSGNRIWEKLSGTEEVQTLNDKLLAIDSIFKTEPEIEDIFRENKFYITGSILEEKKLSFLYLIAIQKPSQLKTLTHFTSRFCNQEQLDLPGSKGKSKIFGMELQESLFYFAVKKGIFMASEDIQILNAGLDQLENPATTGQDAGFLKLQATAGKKVDANIYIRHQHLDEFIKAFTNKDFPFNTDFFSSLASLTELDLILKDDELLINGYTLVPDTGSYYLNVLKGQHPQDIQIPAVLPYNTRQFIRMGFDKPEEYFRRYRNFKSGYENASSGKEAGKNDIHPGQHIFSWIGNEYAIASVPSGYSSLVEPFAIFKTAAEKNAISELSKISDKEISIKHHDYVIRKLSQENLLSGIFGDAFQTIVMNYYTGIGDFIVFSNSVSALRSFIDAFSAGKTLDVNENYKAFNDNIPDNSNIYLYYNIRNSVEELPGLLNEPFASYISDNEGIFSNFQAAGLQFSSANDMVYTSLYLKYNENYKDEDRSVWKTHLDEKVKGKPYLVWDHRIRKYKIIAFDEVNNMYLLDHYGNIIWNIPLAEPPVSKVYQVDYYKNGKIQYLFNTQNYLYLIDLKGRKVDNYPIKLNKSASCGLALFDYSRNKDYRILIPSEDKKTYNYDIKGNQIRGWGNPKTAELMINAPKHLSVNGKDYIILADKDGKVRILDRKGKTRIKIKKDFIKSRNGDFYVNKTNSKGIIITTNSSGHLTYITKKGNLSETIFDEFSPDHYFLYNDFDGNGYNDFIFIDRQLLIVYDRFKKKIFSYSFDQNIVAPPAIIKLPGNEKLLGVVSDGNIFLFDHKGNVRISSGLVGDTPFSAGSLNNDDKLNLLIGAGKTLYNYQIE